VFLSGSPDITLMSYDDRIDLGITVDPDIVHDAWLLADRLPPALAELMDAAGLGAPSPIRDPFAVSATSPAPGSQGNVELSSKP
jgi:hypothetical protein